MSMVHRKIKFLPGSLKYVLDSRTVNGCVYVSTPDYHARKGTHTAANIPIAEN